MSFQKHTTQANIIAAEGGSKGGPTGESPIKFGSAARGGYDIRARPSIRSRRNLWLPAVLQSTAGCLAHGLKPYPTGPLPVLTRCQ